MLAVMLKIGSVDYEETLKAAFPWAVEQIHRQETDHWAARIIRNLGDDAETVALGVFSRLQQGTRDDLLVHCVNMYGQALVRKANDALSRKYGSCVRIGTLFMERDEGIFLQIRGIQVDYGSLPEQLLSCRRNPLVRMAAAAAGIGGAGALEGPLLDYVRREENRLRLIGEIQDLLNRFGLMIHLDDMDVAQEPDGSPLPFRHGADLSEGLKAALCDAAAGYLKELL